MPSKGSPTPTVTKGPEEGIGPKNLSEEYKKGVEALGQAKDLVSSLERMWRDVGVTDRPSAVFAWGAAKAGRSVSAKKYLDLSDAFLGNLSRSIAAERGVLTDQDIQRISKILPKIGPNPTSVDSKAEGEAKVAEIKSILKNAEKRLEEKRRITPKNPLGVKEETTKDPLGIR